ncbi:hypothetical protein MJO29_004618, partial [Puccinia striiformis f. sp. tritici]
TRRFYVISSMEGEDRLPLLARNTSLMEFEDDPKHGEYVLRHVSQRRELFIAPIALYGIHPPMARTLAEEWYGSRVRGVFMSTISKTMCNRNCYNVHLHSETISSFEFGMYAGKQGFRRRRESQQRSNIAGASAVEYCRTHRSASVWNFVAVPMRHEHRLITLKLRFVYLTLIRDKRWAFYTDNSNSQYHIAPSRSFSLIAYACISSIDCVLEAVRDLCRIVFASPMWRNTCLANKDEEANKKCLQMASVLHERAFIEPSKTAELWNRAFTFFNHSTTPDSLINQSR